MPCYHVRTLISRISGPSCSSLFAQKKLYSVLTRHDHDENKTRWDAQLLKIKSARQETHLGKHLDDDVHIHASGLKLQIPENKDLIINIYFSHSTVEHAEKPV